MTPESPTGAGRVHALEALEQLAYTADELDALAPLLRRVPSEVLEIPSILQTESDLVSIAAVLRAVRDREVRLLDVVAADQTAGESDADAWRLHVLATAQTEPHDESGKASSVAVIVQQAAKARRQVVQKVRTSLADAGSTPDAGLVRRLFDLMHEDTSTLREIALALHAGPVTGQSE